MVNNYLEQVKTCRDEIYSLQRKSLTKANESNDFLDEAEILYLDLVRLINQSKEEGLEPNEAEESREILVEVDKSRETIRQEIVAIFSNS